MASKHKIKPKNRNKAYKPKKDQTTLRQVAEIYRAKGEKGLFDHFSKFHGLKPYVLESHWDMFDVETTASLYCLMNGIDQNEDYSLPKKLMESVYKGDLIMALDNRLIYSDQKFSIEIFGTARNRNNLDEVVELPPYKQVFEEPIDYPIFLMGEEAGKHYFKRDGEFKTTWKGITPEWQRYLNSLYPGDDYELIGAHAKMRCTTQFVSWAEERKFHQLKAMRSVKI